VSDLTYRYGAQIESLSNLSMIMMGMPAIMNSYTVATSLLAKTKGMAAVATTKFTGVMGLLTKAKGVATIAATKFAVAMNAAIWPVTLIV
ncbi:hypothetical protein, partial [Pseudomonas sp. 2995-1]|uniref:hypothetical protein n=1 Tax=Pseudomonas sp. 2995-1 TaxID=1712679 RepID=UPI0013042FE5